jgi:TonB family protein
VRVAIRVTIDKQGLVIAATPHEPGPSRYFERLSLEASRKWTFKPTSTDEPRTALLRFHFTRNGTTARASSLR